MVSAGATGVLTMHPKVRQGGYCVALWPTARCHTASAAQYLAMLLDKWQRLCANLDPAKRLAVSPFDGDVSTHHVSEDTRTIKTVCNGDPATARIGSRPLRRRFRRRHSAHRRPLRHRHRPRRQRSGHLSRLPGGDPGAGRYHLRRIRLPDQFRGAGDQDLGRRTGRPRRPQPGGAEGRADEARSRRHRHRRFWRLR